MDTQALLEKLLASGKQLADQGKDVAQKGLEIAADKLGVPENGPQRDATIDGLKKGAIAGGLLALILGTKSGRKVAAPIVKIGSLAALGGIAWKVYSNYQKQQGVDPPNEHVGNLTGPEAEQRSLAVIKAMVAAAKADGHIDASEQEVIGKQISASDLGPVASQLLMSEIQKPLNVDDVASESKSTESAVEIYLASLLVADTDNEQERSYLDSLARRLRLSDDLVRQLELEAFASA